MSLQYNNWRPLSRILTLLSLVRDDKVPFFSSKGKPACWQGVDDLSVLLELENSMNVYGAVDEFNLCPKLLQVFRLKIREVDNFIRFWWSTHAHQSQGLETGSIASDLVSILLCCEPSSLLTNKRRLTLVHSSNRYAAPILSTEELPSELVYSTLRILSDSFLDKVSEDLLQEGRVNLELLPWCIVSCCRGLACRTRPKRFDSFLPRTRSLQRRVAMVWTNLRTMPTTLQTF